GGEREAIVDNLDRATQRIKETVQDVEIMIVAAQEKSREAHLEEDGTTGDRSLEAIDRVAVLPVQDEEDAGDDRRAGLRSEESLSDGESPADVRGSRHARGRRERSG